MNSIEQIWNDYHLSLRRFIGRRTRNAAIVVAIEGMHCTGCASGIKAMLKRTKGVVSAEVSYERKEASVEFNPADISRDKILEVITNLGYKASIKG